MVYVCPCICVSDKFGFNGLFDAIKWALYSIHVKPDWLPVSCWCCTHFSGTMVQFSNRFGGAIKQDAEDRSNGALSGRWGKCQNIHSRLHFIWDLTTVATLPVSASGHDTLVNDEPAPRAHSSEDKSVDVDFDNSVERVPEDLAGRVCYELEPLVSSW